MRDDEKIYFLKELRASLGSPFRQDFATKTMKREIQDFVAGISFILGIVLQVGFGLLAYRSGVILYLVAGLAAFAVLTVFGNRTSKFSRVSSGEPGLATGVMYFLMHYLMIFLILAALFTLVMREWILVFYFAIPAVVFWHLERHQPTTTEPVDGGQPIQPPRD